MGGDVETIKERLDIAEVVGSYLKLEKAGTSYKARCPFHNEKTPSFYVSPVRQSFYCFGCGAKGDIFTFVEQTEGLDFREALKLLAERAGVELTSRRPENKEQKSEKEKILEALEDAMQFFVSELDHNAPAKNYLLSRGISEESIKSWNLGYAPAEWRSLYTHLLGKGYNDEALIKAGLIKRVEAGSGKNPYDIFRDRLIFPLRDSSGRVIAFSGRALSKDTEPKYLNSPDTPVFTKHEVLYGLDKSKEKIRRKDYAILVEGQMDLVLSHQAGVDNTVASSGTAFTQAHLERLKKLSKRIILAFDGDKAGQAAAEKSAALALSLGLEVKVAKLPEGSDPADLVHTSPESWRDVLKDSKPAIEVFLAEILKDNNQAKVGKLIEKRLLPIIALMPSRVDQESSISTISRYSGKDARILAEAVSRLRREEALKILTVEDGKEEVTHTVEPQVLTRREKLEERLSEVRLWLKEMPEAAEFKKEEVELENHLAQEILKEELSSLSAALAKAETSKDNDREEELKLSIHKLNKEKVALEERSKSL